MQKTVCLIFQAFFPLTSFTLIVISKTMLTRLEDIFIDILNLFGILSRKIHFDQSKLLVFYLDEAFEGNVIKALKSYKYVIHPIIGQLPSSFFSRV